VNFGDEPEEYYSRTVKELQSKLSEAMDTLDRYERALKFYADGEVDHETVRKDLTANVSPRCRKPMMYGHVAREALNPKEGE